MKKSFARNALALFFIFAFLFSWLMEFLLIAVKYHWLEIQLPMGLHYLASFGPMISAFLVTWLAYGQQGMVDLWSRITRWRVDTKLAAFSLLSPLAFYLIGILVNFILTKEWPDISQLGQVNYLPNLGLSAIFLWLATFGFGEEIGWRGFALPRLQKSHGALTASIILGLIWIIWHIPAFFYHETYTGMSPFLLIGMSIGILLGSVMLTWLYNSTGGSIFFVAVWHGLFDFFSASQSNGPWVAPVISFCIIFLAIRIFKVYPAGTLSSSPKQVV
jgi:membrane protease YdiL (CAAX protease family)